MTNKSKPTHDLHAICGQGENTRFVRVGVAFPQKNGGDGFNLIYDAHPVSGRVFMKPRTEQENASADNGGAQ